MFKPFFASSNWAELAIFGLVFFISVFALVLLRTLVFKKGIDYDAISALPLADEHREIAREKKVT